MPDRRRDVLTAAVRTRPAQHPVVASSQLLLGTSREQYALQYSSWQRELWEYNDAVGEFGSAMDWYANGMSRMHLIAATMGPNQKEPEPLTKGPGAEIVADVVANAKGGETQFLSKWGYQIALPGQGYLVAEDRDYGRVYDVKSADTLMRTTEQARNADGTPAVTVDGQPIYRWKVLVAPDIWAPVPDSSLVGRIYMPDPRIDFMPTSATKHCITTLRQIDLYNRHIVAALLSRIAFNGIFFIPEEVTMPVNPQFKEAADPFIAELIEIARRGIKDPGSPASAMPVPLRVPAEFIEKFKHLSFDSGIATEALDGRDRAVARLAEQLPVPPEAMTGIQDMNHWNAWKSSDDAVKMYFGTPMEVLCGGLTDVLMRPMLRAMNQPLTTPDGKQIIFWYDASDLTTKVDTTDSDLQARDRLIINDESFRERTGVDESDAPTDVEAREMILRQLALGGKEPTSAYYLLYPQDKPKEQPPQAAPGQPGSQTPPAGDGGVGPSAVPAGGNSTDQAPPPTSNQDRAAKAPAKTPAPKGA